MSDDTTVKGKLRGWIVQKNGKVAPQDITDDLPLFEKRVLRSIHVPELLRFIESLRGHRLEVRDLRPGVFKDLDTIYRSFFASS